MTIFKYFSGCQIKEGTDLSCFSRAEIGPKWRRVEILVSHNNETLSSLFTTPPLPPPPLLGSAQILVQAGWHPLGMPNPALHQLLPVL